MKLYETDITISTDAVEMTSVVGSKQGRIFMLGLQDGFLYELTYQATESWFTKKSGIVNHSTSGYASFIPSLANMIMPKLDRKLPFGRMNSTVAKHMFYRSLVGACLRPRPKISLCSHRPQSDRHVPPWLRGGYVEAGYSCKRPPSWRTVSLPQRCLELSCIPNLFSGCPSPVQKLHRSSDCYYNGRHSSLHRQIGRKILGPCEDFEIAPSLWKISDDSIGVACTYINRNRAGFPKVV